ncbi:helix-turn-helix transcriptional regulator [Streptomyces sp. NPDC057235]|uniref:helix-turn-helix transcriptional regulator n=1 Tax=Streptomyces sp. NPDC057235 TaxID=3346058 RepID=UPI0036409780
MHSDSNRPSDTIAAQVRRHRARLGLTREQLAERCAALGVPELTYSAVVDIENGRRTKDGRRRRHVTADEWLVLGLALAVPPLLLACPLDTGTPVPVVPGVEPQSPYTAWKWFTGQETPTTAEPIDGRRHVDARPIGDGGPRWSTAWAAAAYPASLYPEAEQRLAATVKAHRLVEADTTARREYVDRLDELAQVVNELTRAGLAAPPIPATFAAEMRELDLLDTPAATNPEENTE